MIPELNAEQEELVRQVADLLFDHEAEVQELSFLYVTDGLYTCLVEMRQDRAILSFPVHRQ